METNLSFEQRYALLSLKSSFFLAQILAQTQSLENEKAQVLYSERIALVLSRQLESLQN
jgi:hypothetical protein